MSHTKQHAARTILLETKPIFDPQGRLNWSPDLPMEQWDGVTARDGRVVAMHFSDIAEKEDFEEHGVEGAQQRLLLRGGCIPSRVGQPRRTSGALHRRDGLGRADPPRTRRLRPPDRLADRGERCGSADPRRNSGVARCCACSIWTVSKAPREAA